MEDFFPKYHINERQLEYKKNEQPNIRHNIEYKK